MTIYKTLSGDMWDMIAKREMGSESYTSTLMEANTDYLDTVIFPAGVNLIIPDVELRRPSILPPWKR